MFLALHLSLSHESKEWFYLLRNGETVAQEEVLAKVIWEVSVRGINRISAF